jgi:hypothetical protein
MNAPDRLHELVKQNANLSAIIKVAVILSAGVTLAGFVVWLAALH